MATHTKIINAMIRGTPPKVIPTKVVGEVAVEEAEVIVVDGVKERQPRSKMW